jgi:hypothetical protein
MVASEIVVNVAGWGQAILEAALTIGGLLLSQWVVIYLYKRSERRRLDPFLMTCCLDYASAVGRLKIELYEQKKLSAYSDYEKASEMLSLVAPDEMQQILESIQSDIFFAIESYRKHDLDKCEESVMRLFNHQMSFDQSVRKHLGQEERIHRATPMIESKDAAYFGTR